MFNRRTIYDIRGGDVVQMEKTREELQKLGVQVDIATPSQVPNECNYDVVHLFNLQTQDDTFWGLKWAEKYQIPTVFSPIFWDMTDLNFSRIIRVKKHWRMLYGLFGETISRMIYNPWQTIKKPHNLHWQTQRCLLNCILKILPNSKSEAILIQKYFWLKNDWYKKVAVIPNAVDRRLYQNFSRDSSIVKEYDLEGCVLQVGWIGESKNQLKLLEALYDTQLKIVFVGPSSPFEPEYFAKCKRIANERGNVRFVGPVAPNELPAIYASAGVHILPSWRETPGLASLEAAAAGCRVVSTSVGTAKEYFNDRIWYCNPDDPSSINRAIMSAISNPVNPSLRSYVLENFTWDKVASMTLDAYYAVLKKHSKAVR